MESREITLLSIITVILILSISFPVENAFAITETKITAPDAGPTDQFGTFVAISGNTAIVGAINNNDGGGTNSGSAYIFDFDGNGWTLTAKITASDAAALDQFGWSVSISGDTVIVGAIGDDDVISQSGSAYIFEKPIGGWVDATETAKITASDAAKSDQFGWSVTISGNTAIVGAIGNDGGDTDSGSAYIFEKPIGGWVDATTETAKITASDAAKDDQFGRSVGISGNTAIVGAIGNDDVISQSGSAYIFEKPIGGWVDATETAKITASDAAKSDQFDQTAPSICTIGRDQPIILGVPFLSHTGPIKKPRGFAEPDFHLCVSCFSKYSQISFCLCAQLQISDLDELTFGPCRYLFCRVPPQPNSPPAVVPSQVSHFKKDG